MKIKRQGFEGVEKPFRQKIFVELQTEKGPLPLEFEPLPLGFYDVMDRKIRLPQPPRIGWVRDSKGKFARDEDGQIIPEVDSNDAKYLDEKRTAERRRNTSVLYELLRSCGEIEFAAVDDGLLEFYDKIFEEIVAAGLSAGQQLQIIREANRASGINEDEIKAAKKN